MTTTPPATAGPARTRAAGRLGQGELRRKVAGWLAANPGAWKPGKIAGALGHSAGAVGNALATLEGRGEAAREPGRPVRYRANAATAGAATAPARTPAPPATPEPAAATEAAFGDLITMAGDGDTTVADFVGDYTQADDGRYEFVYGPLVTAMTEGKALLIDDATLISPKVLAVVYPAMDGRRQITVKAHKGEAITAAEGFYVIAGHNPGVHGAVLTDALASRFSVQIQVGTDFDLAHALKIDSRAIRVARNLATRQTRGEIGWAPQLRELIAFGKIAEILGTDAAAANLTGIAPEEDRDVVTEVVTTVFGRPMAPLALGRQI